MNNDSLELIDIKSMDEAQLQAYFEQLGEKKFRASQVYQWLHQKLVTDFEQMTNLPESLRKTLKENCRLTALTAERVQVSQIDGTSKYLFKLYDGNLIESVLMKYHHGNSVCISSQVGCRMGCRFCASTLDGMVRNLAPSEMLDQIYRIQTISGERVDNIVIMGSGEPMDNFQNVVQFLKLINSDKGLHISARNITVSTCGLVDKIRELADLQLQITLAISLHAPNDELRKTMMPIANKYSIEQIMEACRYYLKQTGRRISFEYSLVKGVNDTQECAEQLSGLLHGMNCHVNLIPVNPIKERDYRQSEKQAIAAFKNKLERNGINVTIRREMGRDIDGACGQLRKTMMPIANKYSIEQIMEACRYYLKQTGRRISFEYSLVKGVNDTQECAEQLSGLLHGMNCHVNLIPVNPIKERDYRQSEKQAIAAFKNKLERNGINVTIRREMGRDIDGACGQLRKSYMESQQ